MPCLVAVTVAKPCDFPAESKERGCQAQSLTAMKEKSSSGWPASATMVSITQPSLAPISWPFSTTTIVDATRIATVVVTTRSALLLARRCFIQINLFCRASLDLCRDEGGTTLFLQRGSHRHISIHERGWVMCQHRRPEIVVGESLACMYLLQRCRKPLYQHLNIYEVRVPERHQLESSDTSPLFPLNRGRRLAVGADRGSVELSPTLTQKCSSSAQRPAASVRLA